MGNTEEQIIKKFDNNFFHVEMDDEEKVNARFTFNNSSHIVICEKDESLSSVLEKFKKQTGIEGQNLYFISEGKRLSPEMRLRQINFSKIEVHNEQNIIGGAYGLNFTDVSKDIYEVF